MADQFFYIGKDRFRVPEEEAEAFVDTALKNKFVPEPANVYYISNNRFLVPEKKFDTFDAYANRLGTTLESEAERDKRFIDDAHAEQKVIQAESPHSIKNTILGGLKNVVKTPGIAGKFIGDALNPAEEQNRVVPEAVEQPEQPLSKRDQWLQVLQATADASKRAPLTPEPVQVTPQATNVPEINQEQALPPVDEGNRLQEAGKSFLRGAGQTFGTAAEFFARMGDASGATDIGQNVVNNVSNAYNSILLAKNKALSPEEVEAAQAEDTLKAGKERVFKKGEENFIKKLGGAINKGTALQYGANPEVSRGFLSHDIAEGLGNMVGMAATGPGALIVGFGAEGEDAYNRELRRQVTDGEPEDAEKALAKALGYAGGATLIEGGLGVGRILRKFKKAFGADDAAKLARKMAGEGLNANTVMKFLFERAKDAGAGAIEEGSQRLLQDLIVDMQADPAAIGKEAIVGGIVQGLTGIGISGLSAANQAELKAKAKKTEPISSPTEPIITDKAEKGDKAEEVSEVVTTPDLKAEEPTPVAKKTEKAEKTIEKPEGAVAKKEVVTQKKAEPEPTAPIDTPLKRAQDMTRKQLVAEMGDPDAIAPGPVAKKIKNLTKQKLVDLVNKKRDTSGEVQNVETEITGTSEEKSAKLAEISSNTAEAKKRQRKHPSKPKVDANLENWRNEVKGIKPTQKGDINHDMINGLGMHSGNRAIPANFLKKGSLLTWEDALIRAKEMGLVDESASNPSDMAHLFKGTLATIESADRAENKHLIAQYESELFNAMADDIENGVRPPQALIDEAPEIYDAAIRLTDTAESDLAQSDADIADIDIEDDAFDFGENVPDDLELESVTEAQIKGEKEKSERKEKIAKESAKPLTGVAGDTTADMFGEGETPLFNERRDEAKAPKGKIVTTAITVDGEIFTGQIHAEAIQKAVDAGKLKFDDGGGVSSVSGVRPFVDGFITDQNELVNRDGQIVDTAGEPISEIGDTTEQSILERSERVGDAPAGVSREASAFEKALEGKTPTVVTQGRTIKGKFSKLPVQAEGSVAGTTSVDATTSPQESTFEIEIGDDGNATVVKDTVADAEKATALETLQKGEDAIKKRIAKRKTEGRVNMGIDPEVTADYVALGAVKIAKGTIKFSQWSKEMIAEAGAWIKPHLQNIYNASLRQYRNTLQEQRKKPPKNKNTDKSESEVMDEWFAGQDDAIQQINIETAKIQKRIREATGKKKTTKAARELDQAIQLNIDLRGKEDQIEKYNDALTASQRKLVEKSQNLTPEQLKIADDLIALNRKSGLAAEEAGVINSVVDNYTMRLWDFNEKGDTQAKFNLSTARARQRSLESILEGWSRGYELKIKGASTAYQTAGEQTARTIANNELIKNGIEEKIFSTNQFDDWEQIENPSFTQYKWKGQKEEGEVYGRNFYINEEGTVFEKVPIYAPAPLAKKLNAIIGNTFGNVGVDAIETFNAVTKRMLLTTSLFHHQAYIRSYLLGGRVSVLDQWIEPIRSIVGSLKYIFGTPNPIRIVGRVFNPFGNMISGIKNMKGYKEGQQAVFNYTSELKELVRAGLTLGRVQDWNEQAAQIFSERLREKLSSIPGISHIADKIIDFQDNQTRILFQEVGPFLKTQSALLEYRHEIQKNQKKLDSGDITAQEIARSVAKLINDDFGGLHHGRLGRSQNTTKILNLIELAQDWTHSNVRSMVKTIVERNPDTGKVQLAKGYEGALYRRFWTRILAKGFIYTALWNLAMAAFDDDELGDNTFDKFLTRFQNQWEQGHLRWLDVDVTPLYRAIYKAIGKEPAMDVRKYFSLIGHFRDPIKFIVNPVGSAKHKGSVFSRMLLGFGTGEDWQGKNFTEFDELLGIDDKGLYKISRRPKDGKPGFRRGDPKGGKLAGKLTTWKFGGGDPVDYSTAPSFAIYEARSVLPVQAQQGLAFLGGEIDAFDAITKGLGLYTSSSRPKKSTKK